MRGGEQSVKCNLNIPKPCPFCGAQLQQECGHGDVTDNEGNVLFRLATVYWKHPKSTKCVLGFGFMVSDNREEVKKWNQWKQRKET